MVSLLSCAVDDSIYSKLLQSLGRFAGDGVGFNARGGTRLEANRSSAVTVVVDYGENGFQYHFELAMFCPFYLCPRLQTFKQAEIRYGKVPPGRRDVVISVPLPHHARWLELFLFGTVRPPKGFSEIVISSVTVDIELSGNKRLFHSSNSLGSAVQCCGGVFLLHSCWTKVPKLCTKEGLTLVCILHSQNIEMIGRSLDD